MKTRIKLKESELLKGLEFLSKKNQIAKLSDSEIHKIAFENGLLVSIDNNRDIECKEIIKISDVLNLEDVTL